MVLLNVLLNNILFKITDPFFMVGDDAANKVRVGVSQRGHELG